ncbi:hypothetical protein NM208_g2250 [Fusarium decemcellulare]|uniref:Uncharacterized protein n=1 Tax=Fusarium decemcellulare TaxID=57161 RepID=A0ACC1ST32_9HYPO|nr:hypothetical protein NM208_g2250 [Fusarium decemcellulare]
MSVLYDDLVDEIDRQLSSSVSTRKEESEDLAAVTAQKQLNNQRYRDDLSKLRASIKSYIRSEGGHTADIELPDDALIWQIPAFCTDGAVIDQESSKNRNKVLQQLRPARHNATDDIWSKEGFDEWQSSTESSVLLVQGTSQSLERLERFGVELVDHLAPPVLHLLHPLPTSIYEQSFRGSDVLRQIAIQCLQALCDATPKSVDFLAEITSKCRDEKCDWFSILGIILSRHRRVSIVLDTGILRGHFQDAYEWPPGFSRLVQQLQGKTLLKVVIITCRRGFDVVACPATRVMVVDDGPRVSSHMSGLSPSRRRHCPADAGKLCDASTVEKTRNHPVPAKSIQQPTVMDVTDATSCHLADNSEQYSINSFKGVNSGHNNSPVAVPRSTRDPFESIQGAEVGGFQASSLSSCESSASRWFKALTMTHEAMYHDQNSYKPVKIAVLDTGFAYTAAEDRKALKPYYQRIKKFANFIDGGTDAEARTDPSGHGTAVAVQLLKVSLTAELYICRVVSPATGDLFPDKSAVERAIRIAAAKPDKQKPNGGGWGVDIINMSFGWPYDNHDGVRKAIGFARLNGVHVFASTSNDGLLGPPNDILYPARSPDVIAVDAADGLGEHARTAPSSSSLHSKETRFSAPGLGLSSPNSTTAWSGSSFACPVAAGIGALILEFTRQPPLDKSQTVLDHIREMPAMIALLRRMSSEKGPGGPKFLVPWKLIGKERIFTSLFIVDELRKEYGPDVGTEISDYTKTK